MKKILINIYLIIMLSTLLLGCSSVKTVTYIVNNEIKTQEVIKNTTIDTITFYGINEEYIWFNCFRYGELFFRNWF